MSLTFALIIGIAIGFLIARGFTSRRFGGHSPKIQKVIEQRKSEKDTRKERIIQYLTEHKEITNNNVEALLGVGNTAAYNYLEELEQAVLHKAFEV